MRNTEPELNTVHVVAGVVMHPTQSFVLVSQRHDNAHLGGFWEFPGGKIEASETPELALQRELKEELGLEVTAAQLLHSESYRYPENEVCVDFYLVSSFHGEPQACEHQAWQWANAKCLQQLNFPAANVAVLEKVQLLLKQNKTTITDQADIQG